MDVIAAVSTGTQPSAIGIVRVSGPGCFELCGAVFRANNGRHFREQPSHRMTLGAMLDAQGRVIDRGLAVRFSGSHSYTGEDSAEFHCHGSPTVLRELLSALFAAGARQAEPGEFTKRAFLNGKLDLTEAEAVIDLIDAESAAAARNAAAQLDGGLRRRLEPVQAALLDVTSRFYAVVDYPDEEIEDVQPQQVEEALAKAEAALSGLLDTARRGRTLKRGVKTAIIGRPNAGKSSLLNALAGYDRAIVTEVAGTTRDTVEASAVCGGALLRLIDTAGLRDTEDAVEKLGVERARAAAEQADLILVVHDSTEGPPSLQNPEEGSRAAVEYREALHIAVRSGKPWIAVESKCDLSGRWDVRAVEAPAPPSACVCVSSVTGQGLDALEAAVAALFPSDSGVDSGSFLTDQRQEDAALRAREAVRRARSALCSGLTPDAVLTDAEAALDAVGELTGRTAKEEIVNAIFSRFCVGK